MADGGQDVGGTLQRNKDWVEDILSRLEMVTWDRYVTGDNPAMGPYINVYGWIDRDEDEYKDFVMVRFWPEKEDGWVGYTTSSDKYTEEIHRKIFGEEPDGHNPCKRVEHALELDNVVELGTQEGLDAFA